MPFYQDDKSSITSDYEDSHETTCDDTSCTDTSSDIQSDNTYEHDYKNDTHDNQYQPYTVQYDEKYDSLCPTSPQQKVAFLSRGPSFLLDGSYRYVVMRDLEQDTTVTLSNKAPCTCVRKGDIWDLHFGEVISVCNSSAKKVTVKCGTADVHVKSGKSKTFIRANDLWHQA